MKRRICIIMIFASAVVGAAAAATAATLTHHDHETPSTSPTTASSAAPKPTASVPTSAATSPSPTTPSVRILSARDLLQDKDLAAADFPIDKSSTVGSGDAQYAISPCLKSNLASLTNGNVFSGSWYSTGGRAISESISEAVNDPQAETAAHKMVGWHRGTCSGFTVGPQHRVGLDDGWMTWFALTPESARHSSPRSTGSEPGSACSRRISRARRPRFATRC